MLSDEDGEHIRQGKVRGKVKQSEPGLPNIISVISVSYSIAHAVLTVSQIPQYSGAQSFV